MRRLTVCFALLGTLAFASPAAAWWQFVSLGPDGLRQVHSPYGSEAACKAALKKVEAQMKTKFPHQFPLVGSCEEYRADK